MNKYIVIGGAAVAALLLWRTERGRALVSRVRTALGGSCCAACAEAAQVEADPNAVIAAAREPGPIEGEVQLAPEALLIATGVRDELEAPGLDGEDESTVSLATAPIAEPSLAFDGELAVTGELNAALASSSGAGCFGDTGCGETTPPTTTTVDRTSAMAAPAMTVAR